MEKAAIRSALVPEKIQTPITYMSAEEFQVFLDRNAKTLVETIRRIGKVS
jgi:hypothetical protein